MTLREEVQKILGRDLFPVSEEPTIEALMAEVVLFEKEFGMKMSPSVAALMRSVKQDVMAKMGKDPGGCSTSYKDAGGNWKGDTPEARFSSCVKARESCHHDNTSMAQSYCEYIKKGKSKPSLDW